MKVGHSWPIRRSGLRSKRADCQFDGLFRLQRRVSDLDGDGRLRLPSFPGQGDFSRFDCDERNLCPGKVRLGCGFLGATTDCRSWSPATG